MKQLGIIAIDKLRVLVDKAPVAVKDSIEKYGLIAPIEIANGAVLDGSARVAAAHELGHVYIMALDDSANQTDEFMPVEDLFNEHYLLKYLLATTADWKPVDSTHLAAYAYNKVTAVLSIKFLDLSEYHYMGVDEHTFLRFSEGEKSVGVGFHTHIKGKFDYVRHST